MTSIQLVHFLFNFFGEEVACLYLQNAIVWECECERVRWYIQTSIVMRFKVNIMKWIIVSYELPYIYILLFLGWNKNQLLLLSSCSLDTATLDTWICKKYIRLCHIDFRIFEWISHCTMSFYTKLSLILSLCICVLIVWRTDVVLAQRKYAHYFNIIPCHTIDSHIPSTHHICNVWYEMKSNVTRMNEIGRMNARRVNE